MIRTVSFAILFLSVLVDCGCFDKKCPPPGFDAVSTLDVEDFISQSWYVQEQMVVAYQPLNSFYCVVATYEPKNNQNLFDGLVVYNYANKDKVNGRSVGSSDGGWFSSMQANIPDKTQPSKLSVGLTALKRLSKVTYGPYWVVAAGTDEEGKYTWAIISGGPPEISTKKGCQTGSDFTARYKVNGVGLWLFSRKPTDPVATKKMRRVAVKLGYDVDNLKPVQQEGCTYDGAKIKPSKTIVT